jgi:hypothetical protein
VLKLQYNKRSAYTERLTPSFVEEEAPFRNTHMSRRKQKSRPWISRRLKPGMTVLAKARSNLTDRPTPLEGGMISSSETPHLFGKGAHIKTCKSLGRTKIWSWVPTGTETKNDCADQVQQQFTRLDWTTIWLSVDSYC